MFEGIDSTGQVSDPLEQTQPRMMAVSGAMEDTAKRSALKASPSVLTSDPAQTGVSAEANASAANDKTIIYTPAHAKPLSTGSAKSFFKRRGIGMVIVCVVAVCIFASVFLVLSVSGSAQGHNTVPTVGPLFSTPASTVVYPTSSSLSTQTPESTAPQQGPAVTPSPTSMPTVPVQPTSIPTSTPSEPTPPPQPTPTPTPVHCLPVLC